MQAEGKQGRNTKNRQTSYILILLKSSKICDWLIGTGRVPELLHLTVRIHRRLLPMKDRPKPQVRLFISSPRSRAGLYHSLRYHHDFNLRKGTGPVARRPDRSSPPFSGGVPDVASPPSSDIGGNHGWGHPRSVPYTGPILQEASCAGPYTARHSVPVHDFKSSGRPQRCTAGRFHST